MASPPALSLYGFWTTKLHSGQERKGHPTEKVVVSPAPHHPGVDRRPSWVLLRVSGRRSQVAGGTQASRRGGPRTAQTTQACSCQHDFDSLATSLELCPSVHRSEWPLSF